MVRHNNMIPNNHFHKKWQRRVNTCFNQPLRKLRRRTIRVKKLVLSAPTPIHALRPFVHCPSVRYNRKLRPGRGFTLQEFRRAGINPRYARTVGIAVDFRRRNHCTESLALNANRLKEFMARVIPIRDQWKQVVKTDSGKDLNKVNVNPGKKEKARVVTEEEAQFEAFVTLRRARSDAKYKDLRLKRKMSKGEGVDFYKPVN